MTPAQKALIEFCKERGVKRVKQGTFEVEFFESRPEPMNLDIKNLAKTFSDNMPPDAEMLFASTEDIPSVDNPTPKQRESADMN